MEFKFGKNEIYRQGNLKLFEFAQISFVNKNATSKLCSME